MSRAVVRPTAVLSTVVCLALAACAESPAAQPTTAAASPTPSPTPSPPTPPEVACLKSGTWVVDLAREAALETEKMRTISEFETQYTGEQSLDFAADGAFTMTFDALVQTSRFLPFKRPVEAHMTDKTDGTVVGTYVATATEVELVAADASEVTYESVILENGTPWTPESDPQEDRREDLETPQKWVYECTEDTLRLVHTTDGVAPDPVEEHHVWVMTRR